MELEIRRQWLATGWAAVMPYETFEFGWLSGWIE
jgi:hypothetical protein